MQKEEMKRSKRIVVWPIYLDLNYSRSKGRLTRKECSVRAPKVSEIKRAAESLGLHPEIEADKAHPSTWWDKEGRVTIDNVGPKTVLLDKIGAEIIRLRGGKQ
ncbi:signal recognition particle subunit SRP19/SEC65 family protein [Methanocella conradii]|uniref:signal recognition particle subunit SRP19/SEC65 family protein n=1 Tax=Methanocella conradii TaxID=1175444 RepID=UPI00157E0E4C|nr:signal recognition particle subunit SRP19/SEC65 family protein [Methanocella conradii]